MQLKKGLREVRKAEEGVIASDLKAMSLLHKDVAKLPIELEFQSLERTKGELINECAAITLEEDIDRVKQQVAKLLELDRITLRIITEEIAKICTFQSYGKKRLNLDDIELKENTKANRIIDGLLLIHEKDQEVQAIISKYLNKGKAGLARAIQEVSAIREIDQGEQKVNALVITELRALMKNLEQQIALAQEIQRSFNPGGFFSFFRHKGPGWQEILPELLKLASKEITEHNNLLRHSYGDALFREQVMMMDIKWLEEKEVELGENLQLALNQFIIPVVDFPSGNFTILPVNYTDAMGILASGSVSEKLLPLHKRYFMLGSQVAELNYVPYLTNEYASQGISTELSVCFLLPLEKVMAGKYFLSSFLGQGELDVLEPPSPEEARKMIRRMQYDACNFDVLASDIRQKFRDWEAEAGRLDRNFKVSWRERADTMINEDFLKRWLKDLKPGYQGEKGLSFDVFNFILFMLWYERLSESHEALREMTDRDYRDLIEELSTIGRAGFLKLIARAKAFYAMAVQDARDFFLHAGFDQGIEDALFLAPKADVLYWEKYMARLGKRPKVYYYSGEDLSEGIVEAYEQCKKGQGEAGPLKVKSKELKIFTYPSCQAVHKG